MLKNIVFPGGSSSKRIELLDGSEAPKITPKVARGRLPGAARNGKTSGGRSGRDNGNIQTHFAKQDTF